MQTYREVPPHPALAGMVACLWASTMVPDGGAPVRRRILPDNCIDILWQDRAPLGFVAGMMSRAHRFESSAPVRTVAVRFLPGAARAFFGLPLHELQDLHPMLSDLWPRHEAEALGAALWERDLGESERLAVIEHFLLARLQHVETAPGDRLVRAAIQHLEAAGGAMRIDALARTLGVSRQHLGTLFRERVGLSAKTFAMVCQFRRASAQLRPPGSARIDWADVASSCGYYDQAHLVHAFCQFADETPEAFARR